MNLFNRIVSITRRDGTTIPKSKWEGAISADMYKEILFEEARAKSQPTWGIFGGTIELKSGIKVQLA